MKKLLIAFLCTVIASSALAASTNTSSGNWYISPMGGYLKPDQSRGDDPSGYNFRVAFGKEITNRFNLEFGADLNRLDLDDFTELEQIGLNLDALYFFSRDSGAAPFIVIGAGALDTDTVEQTNASWSAGFGVLSDIGLADNAKLRSEVRYQQEYDTSDISYEDLMVKIGFLIPFGASVPAPKRTPKDGDGDGVNDSSDKCPATPAGTAVNSFGCALDSDNDGVADSNDSCPNTPVGTVVNSRGCEANTDDDGDGVANNIDECPDTPAASAVDVYGCAVDGDDDYDGVANSIDQCPDSASDVRIDYKGCEITDVISLPGIRFETNSSQLERGSLAILNSAAETLNKYPDIRAEVAGHSDSSGEAKYNQWLSARRAASVRRYLINRGVAESRLTSEGYGESQPIADNSTAAGRTANRRVDLNVVQ